MLVICQLHCQYGLMFCCNHLPKPAACLFAFFGFGDSCLGHKGEGDIKINNCHSAFHVVVYASVWCVWLLPLVLLESLTLSIPTNRLGQSRLLLHILIDIHPRDLEGATGSRWEPSTTRDQPSMQCSYHGGTKYALDNSDREKYAPCRHLSQKKSFNEAIHTPMPATAVKA